MVEQLTSNATIIPAERFEELLGLGRPLRVKLGVDPTASSVHLGWAVVLRKLRQFQDAGHQAVLIMGDFTARIGDPSGVNKTRPMLTKEQVQEYADSLITQLSSVLDTSSLEIRCNSEWLEPLGVEGLLRLASHATIARMLERDDFSNRFKSQQPITVTEFLYPLLQGYDSVEVSADIELGGNDQLFNLLVGRQLQPVFGQAPQAILTMPLLVGTDGTEKMSQSKNNFIGVTDDPQEMFGKLMSISDEALEQYASLAADWSESDVSEIAQASGSEMSALKRRMAASVVSIYHGVDAAAAAEQHFDAVHVHHDLPEDIPTFQIAAESGDVVHLPSLLSDAGLASTKTEARRLIAQGGVRVAGEVVLDIDVAASTLLGKVVQVGRRKFVRIV